MRVQRVVIAVAHGHGGYDLIVRRNVTESVRPVWESVYTALAWGELVDVLLEELQSSRPGWELDEGLAFVQAPLWDTYDI